MNTCVDEPAILKHVAAVRPKEVLELGCATGFLSMALAKSVSHVTALDRSKIMISRAQSEHPAPNITYVCSLFEDYEPNRDFDMVVSGMAMHLVRDLPSIMQAVHRMLKPGGVFLFSQRHPIRTSNPDGCTELNGATVWQTSEYFQSGEREYRWLNADVKCFHRTIQEILSSVLQAGFRLKAVEEPQPDLTGASKRIAENRSIPSVLLVIAKKPTA